MHFWHWHTESTLVQGDEIILCAQHGVGIYEGEKRTQWQDGKLTLSTHNLFFQPGNGSTKDVLRLALEDVSRSGLDISTKSRFLLSNAKIVVPLPGENVCIRLSFRSGGMEEFYAAFSEALRQQRWRMTMHPATHGVPFSAEQQQIQTQQSRIQIQKPLQQPQTQTQQSRIPIQKPLQQPQTQQQPQIQTQQSRIQEQTQPLRPEHIQPLRVVQIPPLGIKPVGSQSSGASMTVSSGVNEPSQEQSSSHVTPSTYENRDEKQTLFSITDKAGIAGLMRVSAESVQLRETLRDIDDVMNNASSLVANIRYLKQKQSGTSTAEDDTAIESIEATLGLGAMVRSSSKGVLSRGPFYKDLSAEIHAWMIHEKNVHIFGSMPLVPLIELYSLYNKARGGSDLIAPEDLLRACRLLDEQPFSQYTLKQLSSGRLALQRKDPSVVLERLSRLLGPRIANAKPSISSTKSEGTRSDGSASLTSRVGVSAMRCFPLSAADLHSINEVQFAASIQVARSVAQDLLEELELQGYLCRSSGGFGSVAFHWNIFVF